MLLRGAQYLRRNASLVSSTASPKSRFRCWTIHPGCAFRFPNCLGEDGAYLICRYDFWKWNAASRSACPPQTSCREKERQCASDSPRLIQKRVIFGFVYDLRFFGSGNSGSAPLCQLESGVNGPRLRIGPRPVTAYFALGLRSGCSAEICPA